MDAIRGVAGRLEGVARGPLEGRHIVRGRGGECVECYGSGEEPWSAGED